MISVDGVDMVDVREAARLVDRTPETVRRWIWSGRIEAQKVGNRLLVAKADLVGRSQDGPRRVVELSLADWLAEVRRTQRHTPGAAPHELVLEDRAQRSGPNVPRSADRDDADRDDADR